MNEAGARGNVWAVTAAALVVAAVAGLVTLTGPETEADFHIPFTLMAAVLGGSTFFAGLALADRSSPRLGLAVALAALGGTWAVVFAVWNGAITQSQLDGLLWTGLVTLLTAAAFATRLLASTAAARWLSAAAGVVALAAGVVSVDAAVTDDQFWRVGTTITSLWIIASLLAFSVPLLERALTRSPLWLVPLALLAGTAVAGLVAVDQGDFSPQGYDIFFTLVASVLAAAALLGGLLALERGAPVLAATALAVAPLGLALAAYGIWAESADSLRLMWTGVVIVLALLVALPARLFAHSQDLVVLAACAGATAAAAALVDTLDVWRGDFALSFQWLTTALWIVAVLCCLLVPTLERYRSGAVVPEASEAGS